MDNANSPLMGKRVRLTGIGDGEGLGVIVGIGYDPKLVKQDHGMKLTGNIITSYPGSFVFLVYCQGELIRVSQYQCELDEVLKL